MRDQQPRDDAMAPRWDKNRVLFEIEDDGVLVACAISREALQEASERRHGRPLELLACFSRMRRRIERVARSKHRARPEMMGGLVTIWAGDLDNPDPPESEASPSVA